MRVVRTYERSSKRLEISFFHFLVRNGNAFLSYNSVCGNCKLILSVDEHIESSILTDNLDVDGRQVISEQIRILNVNLHPTAVICVFHNSEAFVVGIKRKIASVSAVDVSTCNAAVTDYNNAIEMFPSSIIAAWRRHTQEELIEIPEEEKQPVSVADLFRS